MSMFRVEISVYNKMNDSKETVVISSQDLKDMATKQFCENTSCPENYVIVSDVQVVFE